MPCGFLDVAGRKTDKKKTAEPCVPRVCGFSDLGLVGLGLLGPALVFLCFSVRPETCCGSFGAYPLVLAFRPFACPGLVGLVPLLLFEVLLTPPSVRVGRPPLSRPLRVFSVSS